MPIRQICVLSIPTIKPVVEVKDHLLKEVATDKESPLGGAGDEDDDRCPSRTSTISLSKDICRICHCESDFSQPLISPCFCSGSLRYVHQSCLQQWIKSSDIRCCELCKFEFIMETKVKPLRKWEKLEMTSVERRKITCSITFHAVALTCVVWSLYVLIHRTAEEMEAGNLEWPFWTKLIVVAVGFSGGIIFMYVQCKIYIKLCRRWRAFNRVIYVQNVPEKGSVIPNYLATTSIPIETSSERNNPLSAKSLVFSNSSLPRRSRTQSAPNITTAQSSNSDYSLNGVHASECKSAPVCMTHGP